jgi:hypothetical protein
MNDLSKAVTARARARARLAEAEADLEQADEGIRIALIERGWLRLYGAFEGELWTHPDRPAQTFTTDDLIAEEAEAA